MGFYRLPPRPRSFWRHPSETASYSASQPSASTADRLWRVPQEIYATAEGRMRSAGRRRGLRRFTPITRIGGDVRIGVSVTMASGASLLPAVVGIGVSTKARNARPASLICQPVSSRRTNDWLKISRSGAHAAKRFVWSVQSEPLEIRIATARLRSPSDARPSGCPAKTFKTVI
jgi:hypothetical protein